MPWVSKGGDVYQAARITINLDTEEITLEGSVQGTLEDKGKEHDRHERRGWRRQLQRTPPLHRLLTLAPLPAPSTSPRSRRTALPRAPRPRTTVRGQLAAHSSSKAWQRATAGCRRCGRSPSAWKAARSSDCSGPTAPGKTTVFYMVVGFIRPSSGRIWLNGKDISGLPMYRRARLGVSYLPQEPSIFGNCPWKTTSSPSWRHGRD